MASLSLQNVTKVYKGNVTAVKDFTMDIKDGEFIVFVGPSGCGKSTTLRMIAGLEEITSGDLYIDGEYMNDVEPKDRNLAMVFQNYALYPYLTVYENIAFGLRLRHTPKEEIDKKVHEVSKTLGIENLLQRKPKALSGGQRQRVAVGRAIVRDAKVYLFDEPLSNLDAKLRAAMRVEIIRLHKTLNTTFIYVTHDQVEAMSMGTRIVVMKDGLVQQIDTPTNLYDHPSNKFVAGFIGTPQMNFFNVHAIRKTKHTYATPAGTNKELRLTLDFKDEFADREFDAILGIRSEDIYESDDADALEATVKVVETLGSECLVYLTFDNKDNKLVMDGDNEFVMKVQKRVEYGLDQKIKIKFKTDRVHMFDKTTEESILK